MGNIIAKVDGQRLTLTVDLGKTEGDSKSGKSTIIATSNGNQQVAPGVYVGLNVYRKDGNGKGSGITVS